MNSTEPQDNGSTTASDLPDLHLSPPCVSDEEMRNVSRALTDGWVAPVGPDLDAFEIELARYTGFDSCVALSSGTAALHLALLGAGVEPGDEVVVQSATFAASAFAVRHAGATPCFCDSETETWGLDPEVLEQILGTKAGLGRRPSAVIAVDLYGSLANYEALTAICERFEVPLIRDGAESLGSTAVSDAARSVPTVLSFNGNKIVTTSGGGALLGTETLTHRARYLATQAREPVTWYEHEAVGFNYRLSNVLAALGRAQLASLETRIRRRDEIFNQYQQAFTDWRWCPFGATERPNRWLSVGLLPPGVNPIDVSERLHRAGVLARPGWKPMHQQPVFSGCEYWPGSGIADEIFAHGLCLPSGSALTDDDVERVIRAAEHALDKSLTS